MVPQNTYVCTSLFKCNYMHITIYIYKNKKKKYRLEKIICLFKKLKYTSFLISFKILIMRKELSLYYFLMKVFLNENSLEIERKRCCQELRSLIMAGEKANLFYFVNVTKVTFLGSLKTFDRVCTFNFHN